MSIEVFCCRFCILIFHILSSTALNKTVKLTPNYTHTHTYTQVDTHTQPGLNLQAGLCALIRN